MNKLKETATYEWQDSDDSKYAGADAADFLPVEDYFRAIETGIAENKKEEKEIHRVIWWAYNDRVRIGDKIFQDKKDELCWHKNSAALINLLNTTDTDQRITPAEIHRNRGASDNCIAILQGLEDKEYARLIEKITTECRKKNRWVIQLN